MEFFETSFFTTHIYDYLTEDEYFELQLFLALSPDSGDLMPGTGGFLSWWIDPSRKKGKRGGLRIIYFYLMTDGQIWLFTIYGKDEASDLSPAQKKQLKLAIETELGERKKKWGSYEG